MSDVNPGKNKDSYRARGARIKELEAERATYVEKRERWEHYRLEAARDYGNTARERAQDIEKLEVERDRAFRAGWERGVREWTYWSDEALSSLLARGPSKADVPAINEADLLAGYSVDPSELPEDRADSERRG